MSVNLDACIHCNLCVRACREVQVNDVIGMAYRGENSKIVFDFDDPMGDSTCVACGECVQACPTGALNSEYKLDSNKCISYWLQSPELIPYEMRDAIGNKFYGCDDCLTSCPPGQENNNVVKFNKNQQVNLEAIIKEDNEKLNEMFYWFYIPKRNTEYLKRNAIIALGNNPDQNTSSFLEKIIQKVHHT